jgi:hypothetical protein
MPDSLMSPVFYNFGWQVFQFDSNLFGFTAQKTGQEPGLLETGCGLGELFIFGQLV